MDLLSGLKKSAVSNNLWRKFVYGFLWTQMKTPSWMCPACYVEFLKDPECERDQTTVCKDSEESAKHAIEQVSKSHLTLKQAHDEFRWIRKQLYSILAIIFETKVLDKTTQRSALGKLTSTELCSWRSKGVLTDLKN